MKKEDFDRAADCFRKAIRISPLRQDIKDYLAMALDSKPLTASPAKSEPVKKRVKPQRKKKPKLKKPRKRKTNIRIGFWLLIFTGLCLVSLAFFVIFSGAIQSFILNLAEPEQEQKKSSMDREVAALYKTAQMLQEQQRYSEAVDAVNKALEKNPANEQHFKSKLAQIYYLQGENFYKEDEFRKAIESYEKALDNEPDNIDALFGLGWANYIQGRKNKTRHRNYKSYYDNALSALLKILDLDPGNLRAKKDLARVYIARNEITSAAEMYREIIEQAPDSPEAERARRNLRSMGLKP